MTLMKRSFSPCFFGLCALLLNLTAHGQEKDADSWFQEGVKAFFDARPKESVAAFDKVVSLEPAAAPQLWQRGLALYYAEDYKEGRKQFELHQTVNSNDVENAAWHFICVAKSDGVEAARKVLIPISGDARVPMKEVHDLFAGKGSAEAVLNAASADDAGEDAKRNHLCYAHLYLGLYYEALGEKEKAKMHMLKSATDYKMDHYMGKVSQVHVKLRGW
jgi:lipoprotein NlpI